MPVRDRRRAATSASVSARCAACGWPGRLAVAAAPQLPPRRERHERPVPPSPPTLPPPRRVRRGPHDGARRRRRPAHGRWHRRGRRRCASRRAGRSPRPTRRCRRPPRSPPRPPPPAPGSAADGRGDGRPGRRSTTPSRRPTSPRLHAVATRSMGIGESGADVALPAAGARRRRVLHRRRQLAYDNATAEAVRRLQEDRGLFVDGVVGRETGLSLGIWPDEESLVVRTPPPPEGAVDRSGFELSPGRRLRRRPGAAAAARRLRERAARRLRPGRPAGLGRRRRRPGHPLLAGLGQPVRQRGARARTRCSAGPSSRRRGTARRSCR